jgi:hypothetical protein
LTSESSSSEPATTHSPRVTTRFVPSTSTNRADNGATTIITIANGISRTPAASGE